MIEHFKIGDRIRQKSTQQVCEITGFIQAWPFGYFALRYFDGHNSKVSVGNSRRRFEFVSRPWDIDRLEVLSEVINLHTLAEQPHRQAK